MQTLKTNNVAVIQNLPICVLTCHSKLPDFEILENSSCQLVLKLTMFWSEQVE